MTWYAYLRRLAGEMLLFLIVCTIVFYVASGQESIANAIYMGFIATLFYVGVTYVLRYRTIGKKDER